MRRDYKVVFKLLLISVINKVYPWIHGCVTYFGVCGNAGVPPRGIVAKKIIGCAGKLVEANGLHVHGSACELHLHHVGFRCRWRCLLSERESRPLPREEERVVTSMRDKLDGLICLTLVGFEPQGKTAITLHDAS